jgi:2-polyprenyl-3-methyl-5-hydroxy-6-metoxy-1,4-benzoquinol methylase
MDMTDFPSYNLMMKAMPEKSPVLDLGCGGGSAAFAFSINGFDTHAVDIYPDYKKMIDLMDEFIMDASVTFEQNSVADVKLDPQSYGAIVMSNIVHFITQNQVEELMQKAREALKPGGTLYVCGFDTKDSFFHELSNEGSDRGLEQVSSHYFVRHVNDRQRTAYFIEPESMAETFKQEGFEVLVDRRFRQGRRYDKSTCSTTAFVFQKPLT